ARGLLIPMMPSPSGRLTLPRHNPHPKRMVRDAELVAVLEKPSLDAFSVDIGAVGAAEVFDDDLAGLEADLTMMLGDVGGAEQHPALGSAADEDDGFAQADFLAGFFDGELDVKRIGRDRWQLAGRLILAVAAKCVRQGASACEAAGWALGHALHDDALQ